MIRWTGWRRTGGNRNKYKNRNSRKQKEIKSFVDKREGFSFCAKEELRTFHPRKSRHLKIPVDWNERRKKLLFLLCRKERNQTEATKSKQQSQQNTKAIGDWCAKNVKRTNECAWDLKKKKEIRNTNLPTPVHPMDKVYNFPNK